MASIPSHEVRELTRRVQATSTLNRQLSLICQLNGLKSSGVKAELQQRIVNHIQVAVNSNDEDRFRQIQQSVMAALTTPQGASPGRQLHGASPMYNTSPSAPMPQFNNYNHQGNSMYQFNGMKGHPAHAHGPVLAQHHSGIARHGSHKQQLQTGLSFKDSPFYEIRNRLGPVRTCDVMTQHRYTVSIAVRLQDHPPLAACVEDKTMRVMIFCAADGTGVQDIAFPHQSEIKINGGEIKANLRGLKNRPGSTRPVDITDYLRLRPNYQNNIEFTYALTNKKFYLVIHICKRASVSDLVAKIQDGKKIPKNSVVQEITRKAQDSEIEMGPQKLSLKCPLSYMRLELPCRSLTCSHIQCFDATSYLQLQEQGPQWLCPICNKAAPFDQLAVDEYVKDILANTSSSVEQVTIETNGQWSSEAQEAEAVDDDPPAEDVFDADFEISAVSYVSGRSIETPNRSIRTTGTPTTAVSRESSTMPRGPGSVSGKRPAAQVIDLTLSSDEDEPLVRPAKRQQHVAPNGYNSHMIPQPNYY